MSKILQLAADLANMPVKQDTVTVEVAPNERDLIVIALRGMDAFRAIRDLQEVSFASAYGEK
jgi:hypothetical protein